MAQPIKPNVPLPPLRSDPDTFAARAEASLSFWETFATYLNEVASFTEEQVSSALAAASVLRSSHAPHAPLIRFKSKDKMNVSAGEQASLEVYNNGGMNKDAFMSFHVDGDFATYFGLCGETNDLAVGGYSNHANRYKIWHAGNDGVGSGLDADLLDGQEGAYYRNAGHLNAGVLPHARLPKATQAEAQVGADNRKAMTALRTKQAIGGWDYESPEVPIAYDGNVSFQHGLGQKPAKVQVDLICKIAELGFQVGDVMLNMGSTSVAAYHRGLTIWARGSSTLTLTTNPGGVSGLYCQRP